MGISGLLGPGGLRVKGLMARLQEREYLRY